MSKQNRGSPTRWHIGEHARTSNVAQSCTASLIAIAGAITPHTHEDQSGISLSHMGRSCTLKVSAAGNVAGFADLLLTAPSRSICLMKLNSIWDGMRRSDLLQGPWVSTSHTLQDLLRFFLSLRRIRSSSHMHSYSSNVASWLRAVATGFVQFLANGLDHYTLHEYPKHSRLDKPPPSFRAGSSVRVHPDAIWNMLHNAETSSSSLSEIIQIRLMTMMEVAVKAESVVADIICGRVSPRL